MKREGRRFVVYRPVRLTGAGVYWRQKFYYSSLVCFLVAFPEKAWKKERTRLFSKKQGVACLFIMNHGIYLFFLVSSERTSVLPGKSFEILVILILGRNLLCLAGSSLCLEWVWHLLDRCEFSSLNIQQNFVKSESWRVRNWKMLGHSCYFDRYVLVE